MFGNRYFCGDYFPDRYFPPGGSATPPTPSPTTIPGPGDMHGDMPSWEWLLYVEEQKRLDEERDRRPVEEKRTKEIQAQSPAIEAAPASAGTQIRHALLETEARARQHELAEKAKAEKLLLDEMIIVGLLSI